MTTPIHHLDKAYSAPSRLPRWGSIRSIAREIDAGSDVLDVGCADGYLARELRSCRVWGLDGNAGAVARSLKYCVQSRVVDLQDLPDEPIFEQQFDVIVLADVLEHLTNPTGAIHHFLPYLRPGGKVMISLPNVALWRVRLNLLRGRFDYTEYGVLDRTHVHLYTFRSALELLKQSRLEVIKSWGAANGLGLLVKAFPPLRGLLSIHVVVAAKPLTSGVPS